MNPDHSHRANPVYNLRSCTRTPAVDVSSIEGILQQYRTLAPGPESEECNRRLMNLHFELVAEMRDVPKSASDAERRLENVESAIDQHIHKAEDRALLRKALVGHWKLSMGPDAISTCVSLAKASLQDNGIPVGDRVELGFAIEAALRSGALWENVLIDTVGPLVSRRIDSREQRRGIFKAIAEAYSAASEILSFA